MNMITILILTGYGTGIWYYMDDLEIPEGYSKLEAICYGLGALSSALIWPVLKVIGWYRRFY